MHKVYVAAAEVKQGDTLCLIEPPAQFFIERISTRSDGRVGLHALNESRNFFYLPTDHIPVLIGDDRCVAGDATAAIEADLAITRMKQSGQWDDIRFAQSRRDEFQELAWRHHNEVR